MQQNTAIAPEIIDSPEVNCEYSTNCYGDIEPYVQQTPTDVAPTMVKKTPPVIPMIIGGCLMIVAIVIIVLAIRDQNKKK